MIIKPLNPRDARVLIVDDSSNDQRIIGRALETYGIRNRKFASTAEECLRDIERHKYDIVLIDYYLPGMNGLDLLNRILELSPETRVILVTGARQESVAVAAMKLGASDYVAKDDHLTSAVMNSLQAVLRSRNTEALRRLSKGTDGTSDDGDGPAPRKLVQAK